MAAKPLKIDSLDLDLGNPRIVRATDQRDAMQKILKEQGAKLVNLAESIAANGLNPMDRFLVVRSDKASKFIVLEGNLRVLAMKLLKSAPLVNDLEMSMLSANGFWLRGRHSNRRTSSRWTVTKSRIAQKASNGSSGAIQERMAAAALSIGPIWLPRVFGNAILAFRLWTSCSNMAI